MASELCIGMFGTCGGSRWRDPFIEYYVQAGIPYFNPQVDDWKPELAKIEAHHLASDAIILFPVTRETYGEGSLAECGFSIAQAMRYDDRRDFVILIDQVLDEKLMQDADRAKASLRARALAMEHLLRQNLPNVYIVDDMEQLFRVTINLYDAALVREPIRRFNPQNRPR